MRAWRAACLLTLVAILAACGSDGDGNGAAPVRPATQGSGEPAGGSAFDLVHDSEAAEAFVTAFRIQFSTLAEGRADAAIRDDVTHVCIDDIREGGDALALTRIPARFARNGITPDDHIALAIMNLAKSTACQAMPPR